MSGRVGNGMDDRAGEPVGDPVGDSLNNDGMDALSMDAEEVRAWFVHARGGGPFLSGKDGRLLVDWLESGVPVSAILIAIEKVAERRQARRTRAPFHLDECTATLRKLLRHRPARMQRSKERVDLGARLASTPNAAGAMPDGGWGALTGSEEALVQQTLQRLSLVSGRDPEECARAACALVREFHEELWSLMASQHEGLFAEARQQLADLSHLLGAEMETAVRERARQMVRARHPQLSASRIWEEYIVGSA